ncbi:MAG: hypothetical protein CSA11_03250 [Chloroflexi bacterium]|nr:MAG: hypothetical protein CSA11_03250 [Chloroflexota bacterium]
MQIVSRPKKEEEHTLIAQSLGKQQNIKQQTKYNTLMRIAFISDIHGNKPALEAVLEDIQQVGVDNIICLGDIANGGPSPAECIDIVRNLDCPTVQGNHELYLLDKSLSNGSSTCPSWGSARWAHAQLKPEHLTYIANLPYKYELNSEDGAPATCVHASFYSQFSGFQADTSEEEMALYMDGHDNLTLFCAHSHCQLYRKWSNSWIINVGSVGMPLDGTPEAKYAIATRGKTSWNIEFRHVTYNVDLVMQEFDRSGLQEAGGLITAVFRYQILTGQPVLAQFLLSMQKFAEERGQPISKIYADLPVPAYAQQFMTR